MRERFLPHGWSDLARQIMLFCSAYYLYRVTRGLVDGRQAVAFDHARELISFEQSIGIFTEPAVHAWVDGKAWIVDVAAWLYVNSHFTTTVLTLAFIYMYRNESFYFVRNMFMISMAIALVSFLAFPTAPPRFMPEFGFNDSVADFTGVSADSASANLLFNPFAAVPSMHVAFAVMLAWPMSSMSPRWYVKAIWRSYPVVVALVIVATANHWWTDAILGAATAGVSALGARWLAERRPHAWAFRPSLIDA